jgi:GNAT superfamily N-acetyltransferase
LNTATDIAVRPVRADDRDAIVALLSATQHWVPSELFDRFYAWKHEQSPFGASPAWVATSGERVIGLRIFLRWEFEHPDGRVRRAVRAVDTATHPDFQGRGVFRSLTLQSLDALRADGVDFVFNTPNDKSRPGYLKMGWRQVGRLPAAVRPAGARALVRMLRSRVPAERWSVPTSAGDDAPGFLADARVETLLHGLPPARTLRTRRTPAYLRWRYGFDRLAYRAMCVGDDPSRGFAVFRLRRRGSALEAALCDLLVPAGARAEARALERTILRASGADYVIRLDRAVATRSGFVRLPRQGPIFVTRAVAQTAPPSKLTDWDLSLGDIELF